MTPVQLTLLIFVIMVMLMALRAPIAVAMFAAGLVGYVLQAGWAPLASFLNTEPFARFASYDLSVIPLFILMGNFATQGGISRALFEVAAACDGAFSRRAGDGGGGHLRRLRRHLRLVGGHRGHHHLGGAARVEAPWLLGAPGHRHAGRRRHAGHPDPAQRAAGDLRDPGRAEHRQAVRRGDDSRLDRDDRLRDRDRDLRAPRARPGARLRRSARADDGPRVRGGGADRHHLRHRLRRHLWRQVHAHRRRRGRRGVDLLGCAGQSAR